LPGELVREFRQTNNAINNPGSTIKSDGSAESLRVKPRLPSQVVTRVFSGSQIFSKPNPAPVIKTALIPTKESSLKKVGRQSTNSKTTKKGPITIHAKSPILPVHHEGQNLCQIKALNNKNIAAPIETGCAKEFRACCRSEFFMDASFAKKIAQCRLFNLTNC
jgi:hypothetical protein